MSTALLAPKPADSVGRKIAEKRLQKGMLQGVLARQIGITQAALCRIEKGQAQPRAKHLARLGQVLGIPAKELLAEL